MICHFEAQDFKYMDIKYEDLIKFINVQNEPHNKVRTDFQKYIDAEKELTSKIYGLSYTGLNHEIPNFK